VGVWTIETKVLEEWSLVESFLFFGHDEWEIDSNNHPVFTAIRVGYQMNPVINNIINKDPKILGQFIINYLLFL